MTIFILQGKYTLISEKEHWLSIQSMPSFLCLTFLFIAFLFIFFPESFTREKLDFFSDGSLDIHLLPHCLLSQNQQLQTKSAN